MICARCNLPILAGQEYESHAKHSCSGAGTTLRLHRQCPPKRTALNPGESPRRPA